MTYRKQFLLSTFFLAVVLMVSFLFHPNAHGWRAQFGINAAVADTPERSGRPSFGGSPFVLTEPVAQAKLVQRLEAVGEGVALQMAELTPEVSGRVVAVFSAVGDVVAAGDRILQLDDRSEQIALARAQLNVADASARLARIQRMAAAASASEAELREAHSALRNAELQLEEAELALSRRVIVAPFSGVISHFSAQVGHWVTPQSMVARIDDRSRLRVAFLVPERFMSLVSVGQPVRVTSSALALPGMSGNVVELDGRIDSATRTLRALAEIDNANDLLRPGMSFNLTLEFLGAEYFAIDPLAIQWELSGSYVWALDDEQRVTQIPVQIIQRRTSDVLVSGHLTPAQEVVTEGVQALRSGMVVSTTRPGRRS